MLQLEMTRGNSGVLEGLNDDRSWAN